MSPRMRIVVVLLWMVCSGFSSRGQSKPDANNGMPQLNADIQKIRKTFPGDMAVYMKNLQTGDEISIDADTTYETFSVIKVGIMAEVFHQVEAGNCPWTNASS